MNQLCVCFFVWFVGYRHWHSRQQWNIFIVAPTTACPSRMENQWMSFFFSRNKWVCCLRWHLIQMIWIVWYFAINIFSLVTNFEMWNWTVINWAHNPSRKFLIRLSNKLNIKLSTKLSTKLNENQFKSKKTRKKSFGQMCIGNSDTQTINFKSCINNCFKTNATKLITHQICIQKPNEWQ